MFLAGEVAAVVLHQDLGGERSTERSGSQGSKKVGDHQGAFQGWAVLRDLDGRKKEEGLDRRISARVLLARLLRTLVEDQLVTDEESLAYQLEGTRKEIGSRLGRGAEGEAWERVLKAARQPGVAELPAATLAWGKIVEGLGHLNGAQEIFDLAFELAKLVGSSSAAADAARFRGKVFRTQAEWEMALKWYAIARLIAEHGDDRQKVAAVLDGLANTYRDRGNLPMARKTLREVLVIGREENNRYALAIGHHDLMTVEKLSGNPEEAIRHGWLSVQSYDSHDGRLRALFDLAGVLRESGELSAAHDAYSVVVDQVRGLEARVLALDALAYVAALRGRVEEHAELRQRLDAEGWKEVSPVYRGQVLYYRGLSMRVLGREEEAQEWLRKALAYAEKNGLNKLVFDSEAALGEKGPPEARAPAPALAQESVPPEILGVRRGLRELRETQTTLLGCD
jgi:tetratricopeptide (TPR) repeat protein